MISHSELDKNAPLEILQQARTDWLNDAIGAGIPQACMLIGRELGESISRHVMVFEASPSIFVVYVCKVGLFIPAQGEFESLESVAVFIGHSPFDTSRKQVLWYHNTWQETENGAMVNDGHAQDDFIVPGQWIKDVLKHKPAAYKIAHDRENLVLESQRQELLEKLLIGESL